MKSIKLFKEQDADIFFIKDKVVAFIGYGNQGRSQALNMRDHNIKVIIGNIPDLYRKRAQNDGFDTYNISEACQKADVMFLLLPDEIMCDIYQKDIEPNLKVNDVLVFAHGYNIAFELIKPPKEIDVLIIAPRMIGIGVRECFLNKEGYFSFVGIKQDHSENALQILLALAKGVGGLTKGGIETTFRDETVLDLFTEQGFGPASSQMMMKPIQILTEIGIPKEAILIELILSGKMKHTFNNMRDYGVINQMNLLDLRTQYGVLSRGLRYFNVINKILEKQEGILKHIESGKFAIEWEKKISKVKLSIIKFFASRVGFGKLEKKVRKNLNIPEVDLWEEIPYPSLEEIQEKAKITNQLEDFLHYSEF